MFQKIVKNIFSISEKLFTRLSKKPLAYVLRIWDDAPDDLVAAGTPRGFRGEVQGELNRLPSPVRYR
jgi:hypothetical protein